MAVMTTPEENEALIRRYYKEGVDQGNVEVFDEFFAEDCIIHRPEAKGAIVGVEAFKRAFEKTLNIYSSIETTLNDVIATKDHVVCRLSHVATNRGDWTSRIGTHALAGKRSKWTCISIFKLRDGKIAEEWVCRDELGMLIELGVLGRAS